MPNTREVVQYEYYILRKHYKIPRGKEFLQSMQEYAIFSEKSLLDSFLEQFEADKNKPDDLSFDYTACWCEKPLAEMNFNLPIDPEFEPFPKKKKRVEIKKGVIINPNQE